MTTLTDHSSQDDRPDAEDAAHAHPPFLAHHYDSPQQQFEAAKTGMWLFLATEILLFGGLFVVYAVFRRLHPDLFEYGSQFLDVRFGALNTAVLILSSFTMAAGVTCAQLGRRWWLVVCLLLTLLGAVTFMGVKYIEYEHKIRDGLVWGVHFYNEPHPHEAASETDTEEQLVVDAPDAAAGKEKWMATCRSCHGVAGEGIPGQGKDMRGSEFITGRDDDELLAFVKVGRMPFDPLNTTGIQMPPRGGNPMLKDDDLRDVIAYLRTFDLSAPAADAAVTGDGEAVGDATPAAAEEFWIPRWIVPEPPEGPVGFNAVALDEPLVVDEPVEPPDPRRDPDRPRNPHLFFTIYYCMTGLHGVHVLVGMIVMIWLLVGTLRGRFSREYYTPVDLGGLYWHVVDLIWIFLFPLFYLIG